MFLNPFVQAAIFGDYKIGDTNLQRMYQGRINDIVVFGQGTKLRRQIGSRQICDLRDGIEFSELA